MRPPRRSVYDLASDLARTIAICISWVFLQTSDTRAQTPVSLELVLAIDTSDSVDGFEYKLMTRGMASAFRQPEVIALIELQRGVAVSAFQWNTSVDKRYMTPWRLLRTKADCLAFAALMERMDRDPYRGFTAIGDALAFGIGQLETNSFDGQVLKIDIAGDGHSNRGQDPDIARRVARAKGIQINGLPILTTSDPRNHDLDQYYFERVIEGLGAFVEPATGYRDFARAFLRKLLREITPDIS